MSELMTNYTQYLKRQIEGLNRRQPKHHTRPRGTAKALWKSMQRDLNRADTPKEKALHAKFLKEQLNAIILKHGSIQNLPAADGLPAHVVMV